MPDLNEFFKTAKRGKASEILSFLEEGVKVDTRNKEGDTALMLASYFGNEAVVKILLSHSAKIDAQNSTGQTALMYAANRRQANIVMILLKHGANPLIKDDSGRTAQNWTPEGEEVLTTLLSHAEEKCRKKSLSGEEVRHDFHCDENLVKNEEETGRTPVFISAEELEKARYRTKEEKTVEKESLKPAKKDEEEMISFDEEEILSADEIDDEEEVLPGISSEIETSVTLDEDEIVFESEKVLKDFKKPMYGEELRVHAVRLNWLHWIGVPFVLIWRGLVFLARYFWSVVVVAFRAMKESFCLPYWRIAFGGLFPALLLLSFSLWLSYRTPLSYLWMVGAVAGFLSLNFSIAEIQNAANLYEEEGDELPYREVRRNFSKGFRLAAFQALFVSLFLFAVLGIYGFFLLGKTAENGFLIQTILSLPAFVVAVLGVLSLILILISPMLLPSIFIEEESGFLSQIKIALYHTAKRFIRMIFLHLPAALFSAIVMIPVLLLFAGSFALIAKIGMLESGFLPQFDLLMLALSDHPTEIFSMVMLILSTSVLSSVLLSFPLANLSVSYFYLYHEERRW